MHVSVQLLLKLTVLHLLLVLLVSPENVGSIRTDTEPLCTGHTALLTCNVTGGRFISWSYDVQDDYSAIGETLTPTSQQTFTVTVGGVLFTVTLLIPTSPHFVSQLSFTASADMNGEVVVCGSFSPSAGLSQENITLRVENISK